jgi:hypothetical protein
MTAATGTQPLDRPGPHAVRVDGHETVRAGLKALWGRTSPVQGGVPGRYFPRDRVEAPISRVWCGIYRRQA